VIGGISAIACGRERIVQSRPQGRGDPGLLVDFVLMPTIAQQTTDLRGEGLVHPDQ